ncbi:MAG TPA: hypothetical protein PKD24_02645, partial [Pyrinomonadaceae bacterium]|nr:hypothetical protein [Pyrinomonadaceae bacterium]
IDVAHDGVWRLCGCFGATNILLLTEPADKPIFLHFRHPHIRGITGRRSMVSRHAAGWKDDLRDMHDLHEMKGEK